jgi:hypothetical protein
MLELSSFALFFYLRFFPLTYETSKKQHASSQGEQHASSLGPAPHLGFAGWP